MSKINQLREMLANRIEEEYELSKKVSYQVVDTVMDNLLKEITRELRSKSRCEVSGLGFFKKTGLGNLDRRDFLSSKIIFSPAGSSVKYNKY